MSSQLSDYFMKCRCCLEELKDNVSYVITEVIEEKFFEITQTILLISNQLSNRICHQCNMEISRISQTRDFYIQKQNHLVELLNCFEGATAEIKTEKDTDGVLETFIIDNEVIKQEDPSSFLKNEEFLETDEEDESDGEVKLSVFQKTENLVDDDDDEYVSKRKKEKRMRRSVPENKKKYYKSKKENKLPGYFCEICHRRSGSEKQFREHMERHEGKKNYYCREEGCTYASYGEFEMKMHKCRRHNAPQPIRHRKDGYFCDTCGEIFKFSNKLREHIDKKHLKIKNYVCDLCPMRFYQKQDLKRHIVRHIPKEFRDFSATCDECGKVLFNRFTLKSHKELVHQKIRRFSCELCGKLYESKFRLKVHIDSFHKGLREMECNICNLKFATKLAVKGHIKRQHPESIGLQRQIFTCDICNVNCPSKTSLQIHMKRHSEPQFPCDICGKKYYDRPKLLDHQSVHRVLEFKCEYCPRSFRHESRLKSHYRVTHFKEKRTYRCEICNSTFTRRTTLRDHVLRQHPNIDATYRDNLIAKILQMQPEEYQNK